MKEKIKKELEQIKEDSFIAYKELEKYSKETLLYLLTCAIFRIDDKENSGEYDERDWKDCLCDNEFILFELAEKALECVEVLEE